MCDWKKYSVFSRRTCWNQKVCIGIKLLILPIAVICTTNSSKETPSHIHRERHSGYLIHTRLVLKASSQRGEFHENTQVKCMYASSCICFESSDCCLWRVESGQSPMRTLHAGLQTVQLVWVELTCREAENAQGSSRTEVWGKRFKTTKQAGG